MSAKMKKVIKAITDIKPKSYETKGRIYGNEMIMLDYPHRHYTRAQIEELVYKQQQKYAGEDIIFMPCLGLSRGYRSMKSFHINSGHCSIDLYGEESDEVEHFVIYVWAAKDAQGGDDIHNDCLFYAIVKSIDLSNIRQSFNKPWKFKSQLGLERDDKIDIKLMPTIEKELKININVIGDHTFTSAHAYTRTVTVKLHNGHYTYAPTKSNELIKQIPMKKQKILFVYAKMTTTECTILAYDGYEVQELTKERYYEIKNRLFGDTAVVTCHITNATVNKKAKLISEYDKYMQNAEQIKIASKGLIDYETCGGSHKNVALRLFYNYTKSIEDAEPITQLEEEYLRDIGGALIFSDKKAELKKAYSIDRNCAYPSVLISSSFKIPFKQGRFTKLTELTDILEYGIYRAVITRSNDYHTDKLFRFNNRNKYTHYDIYAARKLGLDIKLILDDQANALLYSGKDMCKTASVLFKKLIMDLYAMKLQGIVFAKAILKMIWGALCEKKVITKVCNDNGEVYDIPDDCELQSARPHKNGHVFGYNKIGKYHKHNIARFGPFLRGYMRKAMMEAVYDHKEHIFRLHTDGFISDIEIPNLKISNKIGEYKIDKTGSCIIAAANEAVQWEDEDD